MWVEEPARHDADDARAVAVCVDEQTTQRRGRAAEARLPDLVRDDDRSHLGGRPEVGVAETAQHRLHADNVEERAIDLRRAPVVGVGNRHEAADAHRRESRLGNGRDPGSCVGNRHNLHGLTRSRTEAAGDIIERVWIGIRHRLEQHAIDDREHRGREHRAERDDRDDRE
jgi:hypothetical protein